MTKRLTHEPILADLRAQEKEIEARVNQRQRQRKALVRLREVCEPYLRKNPTLTIGEALELDRRARPWAYRKPNGEL
jgi:hypothetical protein